MKRLLKHWLIPTISAKSVFGPINPPFIAMIMENQNANLLFHKSQIRDRLLQEYQNVQREATAMLKGRAIAQKMPKFLAITRRPAAAS